MYIPPTHLTQAQPSMGDVAGLDITSFLLGGVAGWIAYAVFLYRDIKKHKRAHGPLRYSR